MKAVSRIILVSLLLVASAHRLPAPIQEVPESPTPTPAEQAQPKKTQAKPKSVESEPKAKSASRPSAMPAPQGPGQVDPRFDGRWIGVETFKYPASKPPPKYYIRSITTVIGIADSGKMFGVLSGFATGRYEVSPKSSGRTLIFQQPNLNGPIIYIGRKRCTLKLSSDGNTLKEEGIAILNQGFSAEVWATFHRQGK